MVLLDRGNKRAIVGFMTRAAYYRHIRSLGSFPAVEAYRLAGEAAKLDEAHQIKRVKVGKREVSYEVLPDGSGMLRASRSITVYL